MVSPGMVRCFLEHGAEAQAQDNAALIEIITGDVTVLEYSSQEQIIELLLDHGADAQARDNEPLIAAVERGLDPEIISMLVDHGADPQARDNQPIIDAARRGDVANILELVRHGAQVNARDYQAFKSANTKSWKTLYELCRPTDQQFDEFIVNLYENRSHSCSSLILACIHHYLGDSYLTKSINWGPKCQHVVPLLLANEPFKQNWKKLLTMAAKYKQGSTIDHIEFLVTMTYNEPDLKQQFIGDPQLIKDCFSCLLLARTAHQSDRMDVMRPYFDLIIPYANELMLVCAAHRRHDMMCWIAEHFHGDFSCFDDAALRRVFQEGFGYLSGKLLQCMASKDPRTSTWPQEYESNECLQSNARVHSS
jgi:hypothetical protein